MLKVVYELKKLRDEFWTGKILKVGVPIVAFNTILYCVD